MPCVIGIDGGTEGVRAFVFDLRGGCLGNCARGYDTRFPAAGHAEQDPRQWWQALGEAVRGALSQAGVAGSEVIALAVDTTCCSVLMLDAAGEPLRPALIWMDVRAADEAERVRATGDPALIVNGNGSSPVSAEWLLPKALWLATHEPAVFERAATFCEYGDYINLRLTGRRVASLSHASIRWHYSKARGGLPHSLLRAIGLEALAGKLPSEITAMAEPLGPLTAEAARHLGLPRTVQVIQGGVDAFVAMVGIGVARPSQMALITGSSHLQLGVTETPVHAPGLWGSYDDAVYPGLCILEGGQTSTGSIVAWLRRLAGSVDLDTLNERAAALPPGAEGLLVLDHFQGNRTPYTDPHSRGAFIGLALSHGPEHLFRAVIEGIAFGTCSVLDAMRAAGLRPDALTVCGGAAHSPLWLQIHADTAGLPIHVPRCTDAAALGAAVLAATGAGVFRTIQEGIAAMTSISGTIEPRPAVADAYREIYARYLALYPALSALKRAARPAPTLASGTSR